MPDIFDEVAPADIFDQVAGPDLFDEVADGPDTMGIGQEVRGVGRAVQRGALQGLQALDTMRLSNVAARPPQFSDERRAFLAGRFAEQERALYGGRPERLAELAQAAESTPVQIAREISGRQQRIDALPASPDLQNLRTDFWRTLASNPVETIATVVAESVPQAVPGMVGAAAGAGPVAVGANSFGIEYANSLLESAGPDVVRNPEALARWFAVPENQAAAKAKAVQRGLPVAAFDAATAGLAGRFLQPALGQGRRAVAVATAKELGTQMAGGMAGETTGQLASEGRITSVPDIVLEGIAELGGAPAEVFGNLRNEVSSRVREQMGVGMANDQGPIAQGADELPDFRELETETAPASPDIQGGEVNAQERKQERRQTLLSDTQTSAGLGEAPAAEGFTPIDQAVRQSRLGRMDPQAAVAEAVPAEGWTPVTSFIRREQMRPRPVTPETAAPAAGPTPEQRQASQEFDRLLIEIGPEAGWVDNLDALAPQMETAKQDATTITARLARGAELRKLRFRAAQAFGLDAAKMNLDVRERAQLLPALQAYVEKVIVPQRQADSLTAAIQPDAGKQPVNTGELNVGDVLNIDGEPVRVEAVDPDTGEVTLLDGTRFGRTTIADGQTIYVENVEAVQASTDFAPVEQKATEGTKAEKASLYTPAENIARNALLAEFKRQDPEFAGEANLYAKQIGTTQDGGTVVSVFRLQGVGRDTVFSENVLVSPDGKASSTTLNSAIRNPQSAILDAPESVADQNARLDREAAQAKAKADRETLAERQAKPLTGSVGDIGQGDLLGGGDLFSAPAPKAKEQKATEETVTKQQAAVKASRFRPRDAVDFAGNIVGPSGTKLKSYVWSYKLEEFVDKGGEERVRRVSDWDKADQSAATGRDLVHKFVVELPSGEQKLVSAEGVLKELGYISPEQKKFVGSLANTAKTLARLKMAYAAALEADTAHTQLVAEVKRMPLPPVEGPLQAGQSSLVNESVRWRMGDADVRQFPAGPITEERRQTLVNAWQNNRIKELGGNPFYRSELADIEQKIAKAESKLKQAAQQAPRSATGEAIAALESLKVDTAGKVFDAIQGIPVAVWNGALSAAQLALRAGAKVADAIGAALAHIRAKHKAKFDEAAVRAELERDLLGEARFETGTALPDFQPYATAQRIFTKPFGAETLPWVGRLFGPRGKRFLSAVDRALVTWAAETYGVGKAVASSIGTEIKGRLDGVLKANDRGDLNVTPRTPGQSLKVADVLEALQRDPDSYVLTPAQRQAWERVLQPLLKRRAALVQRYGLAATEDADGNLLAYFPRIVTKMPQTPEDTTGGSGQRVGGKQGFQKARAFRSEAQGWAAGYEYETSIERRLVTAIERLYKAMADQRLAANPELQGRTRSEVVADLMEYHAEELGGGLMTEAEIQRQADSIMQRGGVNQPAFAGRTFARPRTDGGPGLDVSLKQELERAFPDSNSPVRDLIMKGNNFVKAIRLGFDLGAPFVQGLPVFFRSPVTWAQATAKSMQALFSPEAFPRYLLRESNRQAARELAQLGSPVGSLPEMLAGLGRGEVFEQAADMVRQVPVVGQLAQAGVAVKNAFGRQFTTFMDVAKLELWKAHRGLYPQSQWPELVQSLEALMLSGRMESVGVSRLQSNVERVIFLASSYYRGAVHLATLTARPGVSGHVARRAMLHFAAGASVAFVGIGLSLGMGEDELKRRFNPQDPNFMQWRVSLPNGKVVNLGFGGMFRSWVRLLGNMVKTSLETPGDWLALDYQRNPLSRWLRGHLAPVPAFALDAFSGRDFMGRQTDLTDIGEQVIPLWMVAMIPKTGKVPPGKLELAASWTGLNGFAQTPMQYIRARATEFNRRKLGPQPRFMPEESQYARLEWALRMNNLDAARKEYEALVVKLTPAPGKTPQRMVLEHFRQQAADGTFAKYRAHEQEFRRSLLPHEQEIYRLAREEQRALYPRLRAALRATQ